MAVLVALIGGLAGFGVVYSITAWSPGTARVTAPTDWSGIVRPAAAGLLGAVLALVLTGWVVAALAGAIGGYVATRAFTHRRTSLKVEQARITALASWCEQLP